MSNLNIYEVLQLVENAITVREKKEVLQKYDTPILRTILQGTFHPDIQFVIKGKIPYNKSDAPPGMAYSNMTSAIDKIYIFTEGSKRVNPTLPLHRKEQILMQILESLESREAEVYMGMIQKKLDFKGLNAKLVREAFPGLIPE
jgi:hypothetical protein